MNKPSEKHAIIKLILRTFSVDRWLIFAGDWRACPGDWRRVGRRRRHLSSKESGSKTQRWATEARSSAHESGRNGKRDFRTRSLMGTTHATIANLPRPEAAYRRALTVKPHDARAEYAIGNVFVDQQRWDEAETSYRAAYATAPNDADVLIALSFALVQPRTGAANAKRFADAEYFAKRATQLAPTNAIAWDRLGVALTARGIYNSDAESAFRRAAELDPNFVVARVHLAGVLWRMKRSDEAGALYRSAADDAKDAPTLVLIADAIQAAQRWNESEPLLRRALEMDPRNPGALFLLGRYYSVNQKYSDAASVLKTAAEVNPKSFIVRTVLARAYLGAGSFDDAFRAYEQAATLASPADRKALAGQFGFTGVGDGYMTAGRARDALRAYQRGLELDPANADLPGKIAAARAKA
jgi:tetratricopeptide (TPR) repeat protein